MTKYEVRFCLNYTILVMCGNCEFDNKSDFFILSAHKSCLYHNIILWHLKIHNFFQLVAN